jgi:hypothetical protein
MTIRLFAATAATAIALIAPGTALAATSCFDLWYARNAIYDENGYCFKTDLAQEYFDNSDCWTSKPKFSKKEWAAILAIKDEEEARDCHVN